MLRLRQAYQEVWRPDHACVINVAAAQGGRPDGQTIVALVQDFSVGLSTRLPGWASILTSSSRRAHIVRTIAADESLRAC